MMQIDYGIGPYYPRTVAREVYPLTSVAMENRGWAENFPLKFTLSIFLRKICEFYQMRMIHEKIYAKNLVCILFCIYDTRIFYQLPLGNKILGFHGKKISENRKNVCKTNIVR